ncbi:MAG: 3-phosphoglycerate dehydrogenase family protein [Peptococcaceae bacterium]|jgi:D-3-phosphoglycerate dehydrogenase|nr:3-phosphoglycerate dehydrogenase family protein [Peptococcaceae bacterium]MDR2736915.1 3-phosphoglycerate dehydrogenase [Gracilibacteraceae bacterium]
MYRIVTLNNIAKQGLNCFSEGDYVISNKDDNPDGVILRSFNMHDMELPSSLKAVARAGAGVNNIPVEVCSERGVVVFNTPGANANAVKELVLASLLLSSRKVTQGIAWVQSLHGREDVADAVEKNKAQFVGPEILGKKLGVIGLGAIGVLVANDAYRMGMEVSGFDPFISVDAAWNLSRRVAKAASLDEIYRDCDYITIHVPYSAKTEKMLNKNCFALMKEGTRLLNFSRAGLVDNDDLLSAIAAGTIGCYVTDFPVPELLGNDAIIPIPHLGASTPESEENCAVMASNQLKDYLEFGTIVNSVNFPNCYLPYSGRKRFCVIHKNVPKVIGALTELLGDNGINISDMINKSKDMNALTLIDVDIDQAQQDDEVVDALKAKMMTVDSVIDVRVI